MSIILQALKAGLGDVCNLVFPHVCCSCRSKTLQGAPLCRYCETRLSEISTPLCYACDPQSVLSAKINAKEACEVPGHENFRVASGLLMRGPAADLLHCFKYAGARKLAYYLAERSLNAFHKLNPSLPDLLAAVPLHPARLRQRGYNQSWLLAEELARLTGVLTVPGILLRSRPTTPQVTLPPDLRADNVEGAFVAPLPASIEGKAVTVVDDVATTGATLRACVKVLLDAGASRVNAVVAAIS